MDSLICGAVGKLKVYKPEIWVIFIRDSDYFIFETLISLRLIAGQGFGIVCGDIDG